MRDQRVYEVITVSGEEAFAISSRPAKEEGILAGISAGAYVAAALKVASRASDLESRAEQSAELSIVTIVCDTGERHLSVW